MLKRSKVCKMHSRFEAVHSQARRMEDPEFQDSLRAVVDEAADTACHFGGFTIEGLSGDVLFPFRSPDGSVLLEPPELMKQSKLLATSA